MVQACKQVSFAGVALGPLRAEAEPRRISLWARRVPVCGLAVRLVSDFGQRSRVRRSLRFCYSLLVGCVEIGLSAVVFVA